MPMSAGVPYFMSSLHVYSGPGGLVRCVREPAFENRHCWAIRDSRIEAAPCGENCRARAVCEHPLVRADLLEAAKQAAMVSAGGGEQRIKI